VSTSQNAKIKIELGSVQETLLIALWCRATENEKEKPCLLDPKASEIVHQLDYDFSGVERALAEYTVLISNITCRYCDDAIKRFIADHPQATVVNIGAGLDTTFYRVDNGLLRWYDLDFPDVIDLRKRLMPETDHSKCIAKSVFDFSWFEDIVAPQDGLFMFARGVLCYLDAADLKRLFPALAVRFPGAEMIFNSYNVIGRWGGNHLVVQRTGIRDAPLKWAIGAAKQLTKWDSGIEVVDEWPIFSRVPRDPSWKWTTVMIANFFDWFKCMNMVHLRFRADQMASAPSPDPTGVRHN
jgi:O-methyltransferase involved in polyketide biosynthesis